MSTTQPTVITLSNLGSMFGITTKVTQGSSQNSGFGMFGQNVRISNPRQQPFRNLKGGGSSAENSNFNNPSLISLFENLRENNFNNPSPSPPPVNLFGNLGGGNLLLNNNNPSEGLDSNVAVLVNALTGMNLMGEYYSREGSFIKLTEFERTEIED